MKSLTKLAVFSLVAVTGFAVVSSAQAAWFSSKDDSDQVTCVIPISKDLSKDDCTAKNGTLQDNDNNCQVKMTKKDCTDKNGKVSEDSTSNASSTDTSTSSSTSGADTSGSTSTPDSSSSTSTTTTDQPSSSSDTTSTNTN